MNLVVISVIQDGKVIGTWLLSVLYKMLRLHEPGCYQCYALVVIRVNHDSKVTPPGCYQCYIRS